MLNLDFGRRILQMIMAAYLSHEKGATVDLTDPATVAARDRYVPLIRLGKGAEVLFAKRAS